MSDFFKLGGLLKPGDLGPTYEEEARKREEEQVIKRYAKLEEAEAAIARRWGYEDANAAWKASEKDEFLRAALNRLNGP